jgi:hypothetical protein
MTYTVIRKEVQTGKTYTTTCNQDQVNNITKYPSTLYQVVSIAPIEETTPEAEHQTYTYYFRLRPPMPGCQPRNGLLETNAETITHNNRQYWGTATYNRQLTDSELYEYDLDK